MVCAGWNVGLKLKIYGVRGVLVQVMPICRGGGGGFIQQDNNKNISIGGLRKALVTMCDHLLIVIGVYLTVRCREGRLC